MKNKYVIITELPQSNVILTCPVKIEKARLLKDNENNSKLLQLKMFNLSNKRIKAVFITVLCYDAANDYIGTCDDLTLLELNIRSKTSFGEKTPLYLPWNITNNVNIIFKKIVLDDETVWRNNVCEKSINVNEKTLILQSDPLLPIIQMELGAKHNPTYWYTEYEDYWECTCGHANAIQNEVCVYCMLSKSLLEAVFNKEYLFKKKKEMDEEEAFLKEKEQRISNENAIKSRMFKNRIILIVTLLFITIVILYTSLKIYTSETLVKMVQDNEINKLKVALFLGRDINEKNNEGVTPIQEAVINNNIDILKFLFKEGYITKETKFSTSNNLLHEAIIRGNLETVKFLVEYGFDVNTSNLDDKKPIELAVEKNNAPIIDFLIKQKATGTITKPISVTIGSLPLGVIKNETNGVPQAINANLITEYNSTYSISYIQSEYFNYYVEFNGKTINGIGYVVDKNTGMKIFEGTWNNGIAEGNCKVFWNNSTQVLIDGKLKNGKYVEYIRYYKDGSENDRGALDSNGILTSNKYQY